MDQIHINTGSAIGAGNGDIFRNALIKTEDNFTYLYSLEWDGWMPYTGSALITGSLGVTGSDNTDIDSISDFEIENNGDDSIYMSCSAVTSSEDSFVIRSDTNPQNNRFISITDNLITLRHKLWCRLSNQATPAFIFNASGISNSGVDRDMSINSVNTNNIFYSDASENRIGIETTEPQTDLHIGPSSRFSSSLFNISLLPHSDPGIKDRFFRGNSDEVFGTPGLDIVCVSRGPDPLITDGLKYMFSPGVIATNNTKYFSPIDTPGYLYSSSVRSGASLPSFFTRRNSSNTPQNLLSFEVVNSENLYYVDFTSTQHMQVSSSFFEGGENDPSTLIFWTRRSPPVIGSSTDIQWWGNGDNFTALTSNRFAANDLRLYLGSTYFEIQDIWNTNVFPVNTQNWNMQALRVEGGSGAGKNFTFWISGSGGGYNVSSTTTTGYDIDTYDKFAINNTTQDDNGTPYTSGPRSDHSVFLYYSRSLSDLELNQIYNFFSGSHGLNS